MDPKIQRIMQLINSKRKSGFLWQRQQACSQPYYAFSSSIGKWQEVNPSVSTAVSTSTDAFSLLSWNIDFMIGYTNERMQAALRHVHSIVRSLSMPNVIFFQEMLVSDLELIQSQSWVQQSYHLTDINNNYWESGHYGTCTLIHKALPITNVFRVHYEATKMERDGLFIDINVNNSSNPKLLRLCNTHLESLIADPPLRPRQVQTSAKFMYAPEVCASVLAGDLNAIQPFDKTLHSDNDLQDAYLTSGGEEDSEEGFTWGQMAPVRLRDQFGLSRMDKVFFCGEVKLERFERFGMGVEVDNERVKENLMREEGLDGGWVTDHLGVKAEFRIEPTLKQKM